MIMLQPLAKNSARRQTAIARWLPAPVGGWNAKNNLSDMEPTDAIILRNWIVTEKGLRTRPGYTEHVTGLGAPVLSLMGYEGAAGTSKLFAATATDIYDVTSAGAVGSAVQSSLTAGDWRSTMFATTGGQFMVIANGTDAVRYYDGSSWTSPSISGVTSANLATVTAHQSRLWFAEKNTLKVWYLGAGAVSGTATSIDFAPFSARGGYLLGMASWTRDGGSGVDDVAVFVTSEGEVHLYSGTDPSSSSTWGRLGSFIIPQPIGRRCFIKSGSDVGIITSQGLIPLSNVLPIASTAVRRVAATERIGDAFQAAYHGARSLRGWQTELWPSMALALVNVPVTEGVTTYQYVYSSTTGRWTEWRDLNAECWSAFDEDLYFGSTGGTINRMTVDDTDDDGEEINSRLVQAFNTFGTPNRKHLVRIRPHFLGPPGYRPFVGVRRDYDDEELLFSATAFTTSGPEWDVTEWDVSEWGDEAVANVEWQDAAGTGHAFALVVQVSTRETITYNGATILMERGGAI